MKHITLGLVLSFLLFSCGDLFYSDYPNLKTIKGPRAQNLDELVIPYQAYAKIEHSDDDNVFPISLNKHIIFALHKSQTNEYTFHNLVNKNTEIIDTPDEGYGQGQFFEFKNGILGFMTSEYIDGNTIKRLYRLDNGNWEKVGSFEQDHWLAAVLDNELIINKRIWLKESKYEYQTLVWDIDKQEITQTVDLELKPAGGVFFNITNGILRMYSSTLPLTEIYRRDITDIIAYDKRAAIYVACGLRRNNGNLLFVLKDANYDGVLLEFNGQSIEKLGLVPVDYFDSGRSFGNLVENKNGDIFIKVDGSFYSIDNTGVWKNISFGSAKLTTDKSFYGSSLLRKKTSGEIQFLHGGTVYDLAL